MCVKLVHSVFLHLSTVIIFSCFRASLSRSSVKKVSSSKPADTSQTLSKSSSVTPPNNIISSTTITISPNGASTVTINTPTVNTNVSNNSYCINASNNNTETQEEEEPCPTPPLRSPRPIPPLRAAVRRQVRYLSVVLKLGIISYIQAWNRLSQISFMDLTSSVGTVSLCQSNNSSNTVRYVL